jgi:hypothetical protein
VFVKTNAELDTLLSYTLGSSHCIVAICVN